MLKADVWVNDEWIGEAAVVRTAPRMRPDPDEECTYDWALTTGRSTVNGTGLRHRHGDGAWALIARVIAAAQRDGDGDG